MSLRSHLNHFGATGEGGQSCCGSGERGDVLLGMAYWLGFWQNQLTMAKAKQDRCCSFPCALLEVAGWFKEMSVTYSDLQGLKTLPALENLALEGATFPAARR